MKPRVERQVPFVRESFWTGRSFPSLEEINTGAERWCLRVAGPRDHGTTHTPPLLLFQTIEQAAMLVLPTTPFEIVTWATAKVGRDCHAQVQNSLYSIPSRYVGQRLDVRLGSKIVRFYSGTELAKTHLRGKPGQRQTDWNDYPPEKAAFFLRTPDWCREQASQLGDHVRAAVDELLDQHHLHFLRQSQGIIRLAEKYGELRLDAACQRALAYGNARYRTIKTILEKGLEPHPVDPVPPAIASVGAYLRGPEALLGLTTPVHEEVPAWTASPSRTAWPAMPLQLVPSLKALRLGGMQDTLPLRLDQAQQQRLGYIEFLELLLGDEIERRANRALASRLRKAHFEDADKTFENFDWTFNPKLPQEQLRDLATGGYLMRKESILLCGPVGVGKTHLAEGLGHQAARQGYRVEFIKTSRLLSDLAIWAAATPTVPGMVGCATTCCRRC